MESLSASEAESNLTSLVEKVNVDHQPRQITSHKGDAVLISRKDWESLQETLYLQSIPGFVQSVREAEADDEWISEDEFVNELNSVEQDGRSEN